MNERVAVSARPSVLEGATALRGRTYAGLEGNELGRGERVSLANDGDDVDTRREAAHELNVKLAEAEWRKSGACQLGVEK